MPKILYEEKRFSYKTLELIASGEDVINEFLAQGYTLTLRQLYYQLFVRGFIDNTERSYKRLGNIISDARRAGMIDWDAIVDRTRYRRKLSSWASPLDILQTAQKDYHRDLWSNQLKRMEVWIEKDALVGVIEGVCEEYDVPFFSCRGYVSDSEMWRAGRRLLYNQDCGQETVILHLGDHDPSGIDMSRDIEERLSLFTEGETYIDVKRIALTMEQIEEVNPPPNPAKVTDSRFEKYQAEHGDESWELDALEPSYLRDLIEDEIQMVRDEDLWDEAVSEQERERAVIEDIVNKL